MIATAKACGVTFPAVSPAELRDMVARQVITEAQAALLEGRQKALGRREEILRQVASGRLSPTQACAALAGADAQEGCCD